MASLVPKEPQAFPEQRTSPLTTSVLSTTVVHEHTRLAWRPILAHEMHAAMTQSSRCVQYVPAPPNRAKSREAVLDQLFFESRNSGEEPARWAQDQFHLVPFSHVKNAFLPTVGGCATPVRFAHDGINTTRAVRAKLMPLDSSPPPTLQAPNCWRCLY